MIIRKKKVSNDLPKAVEQKAQAVKEAVQKTEIDEINSFEDTDFSNLDFKERFERRRGDRRRGYRRIDERTLVSRAQEEAENIRKLASKEGYKAGMQEAGKEIARLSFSIEEFLQYKDAIYDKLSDDILDLSLEVARKIIKKEVSLSDDILKNIILSVFDKFDIDEQRVVLNVNPEEVIKVREILPEVLKTVQSEAKIVIVGDEEIEKGSCRVTTSNGVIDANFETQLSLVQNAFRSLGGV